MRQTINHSHVILVVDDQEANRELLHVILGGMGYGVIEARDGLEAIKIAKSEGPDLILMDLSMPVMNKRKVAVGQGEGL